jgi:hypothetical protein
LKLYWQGENHINYIINIFVNTSDVAFPRQKQEHSENIKEPLKIKNRLREIKTQMQNLVIILNLSQRN